MNKMRLPVFLLQLACTLGLVFANGNLRIEAQTGSTSQDMTGRQLSRSQYAQKLRAMWLGEAIANWTGLTTEGVRQDAPFYTDEDWGLDQDLSWKRDDVIDFVIQDPWLADDDTDIEYVYLHLMNQHQTSLLSADQIAAGWAAHINDWIWVSNQRARDLIEAGALPPATSLAAFNPDYLQIDAQLTTELFGALAPGMPGTALELANLPILTTAGGYAAHAAQFYVVLYALASQVDPEMPRRDQLLWLVDEARHYLPDTSKTADIVDFVRADYLANPDPANWEHTRDRVYQRYHLNARDNSFTYRGWTESSVNFASGLIALLYGEGDFRRTVQIGTLTGWDSDNGTATMGGLLGLIYGYDDLLAAFPGVALSDRYNIHRTRNTLPDYLPEDRRAEDTFTLMAERTLPLIDQGILNAGGRMEGNLWILPAPPSAEPLMLNPLYRMYQQSANNQILVAGGTIQVSVSDETSTSRTRGIADGLEHNFSGQEPPRTRSPYERLMAHGEAVISVTYDRTLTIHTVRFIEGMVGGTDLQVEGLMGEQWQPLTEGTAISAIPDPAVPYQIFDFALAQAVELSGIRVRVTIGGRLPGVSVIELDAFLEESL